MEEDKDIIEEAVPLAKSPAKAKTETINLNNIGG